MGINRNEFTALTGLNYDQRAKCFWGSPQGYPVYVSVIPNRDAVTFRLIAKSDSLSDSQIQSAVQKLTQSLTGISGAAYRDRCISAVISLTPKDTESALAMHVSELVQFARQFSLIPCCMSCGAETGFSSYLLDDGGVTLCASCKPFLERKIQDAQEEHAAVRTNWPGIIAGALAGALVVFLVTYFMLKFHSLAVLTGIAGLLLGFFLMKHLGKKITLPAVLICSLLCLTAGVTAPVLELAGEISQHNHDNQATARQIITSYESLQESLSGLTAAEIKMIEEEYGESLDLSKVEQNYNNAKVVVSHLETSECIRDFRMLLDMNLYSDLKTSLWQSVLTALLSIVVGTLLMAPAAIRADKGVHTLREPVV